MNILLAEEEECLKRLNIDDLYEKNYRRDMKQISIFNKIINRIHKRITTTSRLKRDEKAVWFAVPDFLFGEPTYDQAECIAYIVKHLTDNGFSVRYIHPHTLFISWENWVPSYVRAKVKKTTGVVINEKGEIVKKKGEDGEEGDNNNSNTNGDNMNGDPERGLFNFGNNSNSGNQKHSNSSNNKEYTPIGQYKPSGTLLYKDSLFERIEGSLR